MESPISSSLRNSNIGLSDFLRKTCCSNRPFCFPNADHVTIPRRFEPLACSLERLRASMKISNFERKCSPGNRHMICIGKTKSTSEKGLLLYVPNRIFLVEPWFVFWRDAVEPKYPWRDQTKERRSKFKQKLDKQT